ncbi:MAG: hypothetical protein FJ100_08255 [Deltaproteobacteria bacterium]|nr:hypothetical protein [Deltaproteobacteria bacterium]
MRAPALPMLLVLLACEPPPAPPPVADAAVADVKLPPCEAVGEIFAVDKDGGERVLLADKTTKAPLILGFQGFIFLRLGLRSPLALPGVVKLKISAQVGSVVDVTTPFASVKTSPQAGGSVTRDVPLFFNDVPFAELAGKPATVGLQVDTKTCRMTAVAPIELEDGGVMGADASMWGTIDAGTSP